MAAILQVTFCKAFSLMKILGFWLKFYRFVPEGSIDNKQALDQTMAWRRAGDKPLSEPEMA